MAAPTRLVALLAALPLVLGACGQTVADSAGDFKGDQKDVAQTIEDLQSFARKGQADKICTELLAADLVTQIKTASKDTCDKGLKDSLADADAFELSVKKVTITGDQAVATVLAEAGDDNTTQTLKLVKVASAWKISTLGTPAAS
jgi:hypothetical protein